MAGDTAQSVKCFPSTGWGKGSTKSDQSSPLNLEFKTEVCAVKDWNICSWEVLLRGHHVIISTAWLMTDVWLIFLTRHLWFSSSVRRCSAPEIPCASWVPVSLLSALAASTVVSVPPYTRSSHLLSRSIALTVIPWTQPATASLCISLLSINISALKIPVTTAFRGSKSGYRNVTAHSIACNSPASGHQLPFTNSYFIDKL